MARRFIASLLYPHASSTELAELYHQRWEIELQYAEIEQTLQEGELVLRSEQPALVRQEAVGCC